MNTASDRDNRKLERPQVVQDSLVETYLSTVHRLAFRMGRKTPASISRDDLVSAGMFGLAEAASRFDQCRVEQFRAYAEARIRGAMIDEIRSQMPLPRDVFKKSAQVRKAVRDLKHELNRHPEPEEVAVRLDISLEKYHRLIDRFQQMTILSPSLIEQAVRHSNGYPDRDPDNPQDHFLFNELRERLAECIRNLSDREQVVLSSYYKEDLRLKEIGDRLGVTESRISQILSGAISRLRELLEKSNG